MIKNPSMAFDLALDKSTVREYDANGHLLVKVANCSKANVCPYYGREIPGWQEMGLDGDHVYNLYRHPDELRKAAHTLGGKPIVHVHRAQTADDHDTEIVVGAVGTDARFEDPYVKASLSIWTAEAIDLIETEEQKELSPGYRYTADMTPGNIDDLHYDGIMRDISFNHLALVNEGRTGPDVVVGDLKPETLSMKLKARKNPKIQALVLALDEVPAEGVDLSKIELALDEAEKEAEDEDPDAAEDEDPDAEDEDPDDMPKNAMDAAAVSKLVESGIKKALKGFSVEKVVSKALIANDAKHTDIAAARIAVKPIVGEVTGAFDSADDIYRLALDAQSIDHKGVTGAGLAGMVRMMGAPRTEPDPIALDTAFGVNPFKELM